MYLCQLRKRIYKIRHLRAYYREKMSKTMFQAKKQRVLLTPGVTGHHNILQQSWLRSSDSVQCSNPADQEVDLRVLIELWCFTYEMTRKKAAFILHKIKYLSKKEASVDQIETTWLFRWDNFFLPESVFFLLLETLHFEGRLAGNGFAHLLPRGLRRISILALDDVMG
jgi:hypothetical protein